MVLQPPLPPPPPNASPVGNMKAELAKVCAEVLRQESEGKVNPSTQSEVCLPAMPPPPPQKHKKKKKKIKKKKKKKKIKKIKQKKKKKIK